VSITKLKLITTVEHAALRLDQAIADFLTESLKRPVSKAKARKLIMAGAVHVRGQRARIPSQGLLPGAEIAVSVDLTRLFSDSTSRDRPFEVIPDRILFEDEDLIVVDKPAGLPSQPTVDEARDNLFAAVGRFLAKRDAIAKPYVGVHQRLDRDTSGVVLFTKSGRVNAAVGEIFSKHLGTKIYQALTIPRAKGLRSKLKQEWTIKNYLGKIPSRSKRARYGAVRSDGEFAETSFRVIAEYPRGLWIEAIPKTGRTHQIRVHLSEYGLPILGDDLYGDNNPGEFNGLAPHLMLHASQLIFPHPITKREISIQSPLPDDFQRCLQNLRHSRNLRLT
jgi:23S rRNA pseudouridine1911/1915/1917 synthase